VHCTDLKYFTCCWHQWVFYLIPHLLIFVKALKKVTQVSTLSIVCVAILHSCVRNFYPRYIGNERGVLKRYKFVVTLESMKCNRMSPSTLPNPTKGACLPKILEQSPSWEASSSQLTKLLTLILLTWRIWWAFNNASRWQIGFNLAFKGLISYYRFRIVITVYTRARRLSVFWARWIPSFLFKIHSNNIVLSMSRCRSRHRSVLIYNFLWKHSVQLNEA